MAHLFSFIVGCVIYAACLWGAGKITGVAPEFKEMVIVVVVVSVVTMIPVIGGLLGIILLFALLKKFTEYKVFPDLALMVLVSSLAYWIVIIGIVHATGTLPGVIKN